MRASPRRAACSEQHPLGASTRRADARAPPPQEGDADGKYAKKCVTITVCETVDVSGRNPTEVGSIVLNLAEFASADGRPEELRKPLKTSGAVTAIVGDPYLSMSVRCGV